MLRRLKKLFDKKAVVLMYHRIAEVSTDPWQLAVSPHHFEEQLQVLKKSFNVIPLDELIGQHTIRSVSQGSVCISFDDGYRDNYLFAKPLLEKYQCAASFFLSTHFINSDRVFWSDELGIFFLRTPKLPVSLFLTIDHQPYVAELDNEGLLTPEQMQQHASWIWLDPPPTRRCSIYLDLWKQIKPLPFQQIEDIMRQIRTWAGTNASFQDQDLPVTTEQVKDLLSHPLFTAGIHTVTHPELPSHPEHVQQFEIAACRQQLLDNFQQQVSTIAYPYGKYNDTTLSIVQQQLTAAFTTHEEPVTNRSDRYQLGRVHVRNWNGKDFETHLRNWSKTLFY